MNGEPRDRSSLRLSATLLLAGQLLYIAVTRLHPAGNANNPAEIFTVYAGSGAWTAVHFGQFVAMAILLAGLITCFSLDVPPGAAGWVGRLGAAAAVAALALYGVLQAVDGVALKQAVDAWASAPESEKMARLAGAEAIRWLEWGARSYHNFALGLALLLLAAKTVQADGIPRPIASLIGLSGLTYLVQGWVVGTEGFSQTGTVAIVLAFVLDLVWMSWLAVLAWRMPAAAAP